MPLGVHFSEELRASLRLKRIAKGAAMLDRAETELVNFRPRDPNAANLLLLLAQWVDVGYRDHEFLDVLPRRAARTVSCASRTWRIKAKMRKVSSPVCRAARTGSVLRRAGSSYAVRLCSV